MARYLITGIAGFIGSSLARALVARKEQVRGIDDLSTGRLQNLDGILDRVDFRQVSLCDAAAVRAACQGADYVLHQAAFVSVPLSIEQLDVSHRCNVDGTLQVLAAAREANVRRVLHASSSAVYGNRVIGAAEESMLPAPVSPYAVQKLIGEHYARMYREVFGLEVVSLRYFNVFGPRQGSDSPYSGVVARFIAQMLEGATPTIFGDGAQSRDFTYVDDVVRANLLACHAPAEAVAGRVFNIAAGRSQTVNQLYEAVACILGHREPARHALPRGGDISYSEACIRAATEAFGYRPEVSFEAGLFETVEWFRTAGMARPIGVRSCDEGLYPAAAKTVPAPAGVRPTAS